AVLIAASQLPTLLGIDADRAGTLIDTVRNLWPRLGDVDIPTLTLGGLAIAALLIADRLGGPALWKLGVRPPWRTAIVKAVPLVVLLVCAAMVSIGDLDIRTVDRPPSGLPPVTMPSFDADAWWALAPSAAIVALVIFVTGTAVAKSLAGRRRQALSSNAEAVAMGAANIAAAATGGYAVGVSLSRSALVYDSGARTPLASAIAALIVLLVALFLAGPLALLPSAALAALVMSAVFGLIKTREIAAVWRHSRREGLVFLVTLLATLGLGVEWGLAAGAAAGIAVFLWVSSKPRVTRLGADHDIGEGDIHLRSVDRDDVEVDSLPVLAVRIDRSLYFANAGHCEDRLLALLARHQDAKALLIDMKSVNDIDASGVAMLERLVDHLDEKDLIVAFAEVHEPVAEACRKSHALRPRKAHANATIGLAALREQLDGAR
ncbi:MAG: SulP family inorganic anion transporter, partial [Pseudomonadota bacterium]